MGPRGGWGGGACMGPTGVVVPHQPQEAVSLTMSGKRQTLP